MWLQTNCRQLEWMLNKQIFYWEILYLYQQTLADISWLAQSAVEHDCFDDLHRAFNFIISIIIIIIITIIILL